MSNTDIWPPQPFSTTGPFVQTTSNRITPDGPWSNPTSYPETKTVVDGARSRRSLSTPSYFFASGFGNLPENAFSYEENTDRRFCGKQSYETTGVSGGYFALRYDAEGAFPEGYVSIPVHASIPTLVMTNLDNMVKQKVFTKVRDSDINIAVTYGEREQTLKLLESALKRVGKAYGLAKRGQFALAARALAGGNSRSGIRGQTASSWLELQYGWLPLLSEIEGACKTLHKQIKYRQYVVIQSRKSIHEAANGSVLVDGFLNDYTAAEALYESSVRVKMECASVGLKTATELGLTNPLLVAWELVPFSFVVDWALPIGSFLSQFDSSLGWTFKSGSITRFFKRRATKTRSVANVPSTYVRYEMNGSRYLEEVSCTRVAILSWADMITIPAIKNPLSVTHAANALALLTSKR